MLPHLHIVAACHAMLTTPPGDFNGCITVQSNVSRHQPIERRPTCACLYTVDALFLMRHLRDVSHQVVHLPMRVWAKVRL